MQSPQKKFLHPGAPANCTYGRYSTRVLVLDISLRWAAPDNNLSDRHLPTRNEGLPESQSRYFSIIQ